jgi:uncharacterized protein DUF1707
VTRQRRHLRPVGDGSAVADAGGYRAGDRRVGDAERARAADALARAQRDGRFGSSDLYEQRMDELPAARCQADLDRLTGDLDDLVPAPVRQEVLDAVAKAHARGVLDFDEFDVRSDRSLGPLTYAAANRLVTDLGYEIADRTTAVPSRWRRWLGVVAVPAAVGGIVGTGLVAVPAAVDLPGDAVHWLPLAVGTGLFAAIGTAIAAVAWRVRRPPGAGSASPPPGPPEPPGISSHSGDT